MAEQQITIDYTIAANARQDDQQIDVSLVLTYDDSQTRTAAEKNHDAYKVDSASGTYTTTNKDGTVTTHEITGLLRRQHLGNNDNLILVGGGTLVDRHGITFEYSDPIGRTKVGEKHTKSVNLFLDPQKGGKLTQFTSFKSRVVTLTNDPTPTPTDTSTASVEEAAVSPLCFAQGTLIRTARGDIAVEALRVGDLAITATGALRPIVWLGHRHVDLASHPRPSEAAPVRVAAHAFGENLPSRDLYLSPGHPVLVGADADHEGGHLVPIMCLVNGTTVRRIAAETVTWWHVELDRHDVLLAEGLPAESYIELGDRAFFTDAADGLLESPDLVLPGMAGRCRPVAIDGPVVEAARGRLATTFASRLGEACAWPVAGAAHDF